MSTTAEWVSLCECGQPATANGRECPACYRERLGSVSQGFAPTRSLGAGQMDRTASRRWESRLEDYRATRHEGIQPKGTRRSQIDEAKRISDDRGAAYMAGPHARSGASA